VGAGARAAPASAALAARGLATRRVDAAYAALADGNLARAVTESQRAQALNPLSIEPLHAHATAEELRGDPETWYELGLFEFESRGNLGAALRYLDRSWGLDRQGPAGPVLNDVRDAIAKQSR
jgi:hypothetical protein